MPHKLPWDEITRHYSDEWVRLVDVEWPDGTQLLPRVHAPGDVWIRGTRIDLCVIVEDYLDGRLTEQIVLEYPTLDLEAVYGAIAYFLGHQEAVMRYLELIRESSDALRQQPPDRCPTTSSSGFGSIVRGSARRAGDQSMRHAQRALVRATSQ